MKKIGVITTQYAPNYGALLQTFALQKFLGAHCGEKQVEVINYFPPHVKAFWKLLPGGKGLRNLALNLYLLLNPKFIFKKKKLLNNFRKFIAENITCSKKYYTYEELQKTEDCYDTVICGSDQIWNITRHDDPNWFLYFTKDWENCKKIAYAPSVADKIPQGHEENLRKYLENLSHISVREDVDVQQLQAYTDKEIHHVCDPVFLLNEKEWEAYLPECPIKEPYILCYFISTGDLAADVVKKMRELTGLKVVHVNVNPRDKVNADYDIRTANPFEFASYVKNAAYVCTNSFHCTAFSMLFQKNFVVLKKQMANSRMESLIRASGLDNRFVAKEEVNRLAIDKLKTDYTLSKMEQFIANSKSYILGAINGEK